MTKLVVVESPTKAKTIGKYLPDGYVVRASMGHVRDLPDNASQLPEKLRKASWASLGVDVDHGFEPQYVIKDARSKKAVAEIKKEMAQADELILATDEDREGEAISWHLVQLLKPRVPTRRMVFHEITRSAIRAALTETRDIDTSLVEAQETRRILDRLVGYPLSLLVAKKIKFGLSAGRVQSVAVRLLVQRERERRQFRMGSYWDLKADLASGTVPFQATLEVVDGSKVATGKDFDEHTGAIAAGRDVMLLDEARARDLESRLAHHPWVVTGVNESAYVTSPKPPFTTSTLQQEASRKLGIGARETMALAQSLYEQGFISYMRTDSTHLSKQALDAARLAARELYGDAYVPASPRIYKSTAKGAQEAHEAIRPTGDAFVPPSASGLHGKEARLYELIWKRTVACQMEDARRTTIRVDLNVTGDGTVAIFRAKGNRIDFPGYIRAYVEGADDPDAALENQETILPPLRDGQTVDCRGLAAVGHETKPPARFTEATLVKALEEHGIGRPSTYAPIMSKITGDTRYARRVGRTLIPTFLAFAVTALLERHFPELVDVAFTARLEDDLDQIASGRGTKNDYLERFYHSDAGFAHQIEHHTSTIDPDDARLVALDDLDVPIRVGRFGPYAQIQNDGETLTVDIPEDVAPADLTAEDIRDRLRRRTEGPERLGVDPATGMDVLLKSGPFGHYVQLGEDTQEGKPKRCSIPKGEDPSALGLDRAIQLLSLPRTLGQHPDDGKPVQVGMGRFGPYTKHGSEFRSLPSFEKLFTATLDEALALLAEPKGRRRTFTVLRELGPHPETGEMVAVYEGRYGPFVKADGKNASLPKGRSVEELTVDEALKLLAEKKDRPRRGRGASAGAGAPKAKKAAAKKKAPAKKKTGAKKKKAPATTKAPAAD